MIRSNQLLHCGGAGVGLVVNLRFNALTPTRNRFAGLDLVTPSRSPPHSLSSALFNLQNLTARRLFTHTHNVARVKKRSTIASSSQPRVVLPKKECIVNTDAVQKVTHFLSSVPCRIHGWAFVT